MRNLLPILLLFAVLGPAASLRAQDQPSKFELYGGYSYIRFNINANVSGQPYSQIFNGNGGAGEVLLGVNRWLGVLGDASGYWATNSVSGGAAIPYLFGPRANLHRGRITPFVQTLFGGIATSSGIVSLGWQNNFAMTAGGGIDLRISRHFSIRPVQADYFMTRIPNGLNNRQDNLRLGAGIVLHIG